MRSVTRAGSTVLAAVVEDADRCAVHDPRRAGVVGVDPDVLAVGAREDRLVVVGRVRPRPRLRRHQLSGQGELASGLGIQVGIGGIGPSPYGSGSAASVME